MGSRAARLTSCRHGLCVPRRGRPDLEGAKASLHLLGIRPGGWAGAQQLQHQVLQIDGDLGP
ncbi:hypothetical protein ACFVZH_39100 [Streptomyces sp. NPDC059534]|uniref:hypothetical protein n=1 Tax=Streptomyces sp. NPDC059534 TaxID=3346859 RepID=UPI0036832BA6